MNKTSALRIRISQKLHDDFLAVCKKQDISGSYVLREYMKTYVEQNNMSLQEDLFLNQERGDKQNEQ